MGARDLFRARADANARVAPTAQVGVADTGEDRKPGLLVLAAARVRGEPERVAADRARAPRGCSCESLVSRVSSLLAGREAASCECCRFFGHYSQ